MVDRLCTFCSRHESDKRPWVPSNPGLGCTYGYAHEFPEAPVVKAKPEKKTDKKLCIKCGLHPKNPAFATKVCEHEYPS